MKTLRILVAMLTFSLYLLAQVPEKMNYQAVVRNSNNELVVNKQIGVLISILQDALLPSTIYSETHTASTNSNGLITLQVGAGTVVSGNFPSIKWENGSTSISANYDLSGGTNYALRSSSQLLSVPYALHAKTAENLTTNKETLISIIDSLSIGRINSGGIDFSGDSQQPGLATMTNIAQLKDKVLSKIYFYSSTSGKQRFGIGTLDQRNWGIIEHDFELNMKAGYNEIDLLTDGYVIPANQQLFAYYHYSAMKETLTWNPYSSIEDNTSFMVYGSVSETLSPIATTYGGSINLKYDLVSIDSPFATKSEMQSVKATAEKAYSLATKTSNNLGFVSDRNGKKYKLLVVNSQLQLIPLLYKKVLVISNSYGMHDRVYSYGWCGNRGMASSVEENDFVHLLQKGLKQKDNSASTVIVNVAGWERNFSIDKKPLLDKYLTSEIDCIVFRAGENVSDDTNFATALIDLMNYCFNKVPTADGYICSMLFPVASKDKALLIATDSLNLTYVNCGVSDSYGYTSRMGDYVLGDYTSDNGNTWDVNNRVLYAISYNGVAGHPGDYGMLHQANSILEVMQYPALNIAHKITVIDNSNIGHTCFNKWVEGGVFNIHTTASIISAIDKNGNTLSTTKHKNGVVTFMMPDTDVVVTIRN